MTEVGHHHHKTKHRRTPKREPHPITNHPKFTTFIDKFVYVLAFAGPLMTIPQILEIWVHHNGEGVSALTWSAYFIFNIFWLTYGILHKEAPIILAYILWMFVNGSVAIGAMLY